jgi:hypothetical protein
MPLFMDCLQRYPVHEPLRHPVQMAVGQGSPADAECGVRQRLPVVPESSDSPIKSNSSTSTRVSLILLLKNIIKKA